MPIPIPAVPNYTVNTPAMPDPLQKAAQFAQLKSMLGQQQLLPLEVQERQQQIQDQQTQNEMQQLQLKTQKAESDYWADPDKFNGAPEPSPAYPDAPPSSTRTSVAQLLNISADDPVVRMAAGQIKAGVPGQAAIANAKSTLDFRKAASQATAEQQTVLGNAFSHLGTLAAPIIAEKDPQKQAQMIQDAMPSLAEWAKPDPSLAQIIPQLNVSNFVQFANRIGAEKDALDLVKAGNEAVSSAATAQKNQMEVAPPSEDQRNTFISKTIPLFASLRPEQKSAFIDEAKGARNTAEFQKVVERADMTDKAEQMHADSLAQTKALADIHFADKGLESNDKTWTDPQHGYLTVASQVKFVKDALKAGVDGNGLATSLAPTMTALGINSFNQMHRISPAEAQAAAMPGGFAERFNAWADKAFEGKLNAQVAKEGNELMDEMLGEAHQRALQATQMKAQGYNIPANKMPAMTRDGQVTTLDKVPAASAPVRYTPPAGAPTATGKGGEKLVLDGNKWVDFTTGKPPS